MPHSEEYVQRGLQDSLRGVEMANIPFQQEKKKKKETKPPVKKEVGVETKRR